MVMFLCLRGVPFASAAAGNWDKGLSMLILNHNLHFHLR